MSRLEIDTGEDLQPIPASALPAAAAPPVQEECEEPNSNPCRPQPEFTFRRKDEAEVLAMRGQSADLTRNKKQHYSIKENLISMLQTTKMMEHSQPPRLRQRAAAPKKAPVPQKTKVHSISPAREDSLERLKKALPKPQPKPVLLQRARTETESVQTEEKEPGPSERCRFSERFGKIVKQRSQPRPLHEFADENSTDVANLPRVSVARMPREHSGPHTKSPIMVLNEETEETATPAPRRIQDALQTPSLSVISPRNPRWSHLEQLLEKNKGLKEPLDRFVYGILNRGRKDFETRYKKLTAKGSSAYASAGKEFEACVVRKLPSSVKEFGERTVFTPELLKELAHCLQEKRWLKLYLAKVLMKRGLISHIRELFVQHEKVRQAAREHRADYKKFARLKYLLTAAKAKTEQEEKDSARKGKTKPFVCGVSKSARPPRLPRKQAELTQQNIEELNARQLASADQVAKAKLRVAGTHNCVQLSWTILRLEVLIRKERNKYLDLILRNDQNMIQHFFMSVWLHSVKIGKEKRELVQLSRAHVERSLAIRMLRLWSRSKHLREEHEKFHQVVMQELSRALLRRTLRRFAAAKERRRQLRRLRRVAEDLSRKACVARAVYAWKSYVEYKESMKRRVQQLMNKRPGSCQFLDKARIEEACKAKIASVRRTILAAANKTTLVLPEVPEKSRTAKLDPDAYIKPSYVSLRTEETAFATVRSPLLEVFSNRPLQVPEEREEPVQDIAKTKKLTSSSYAAMALVQQQFFGNATMKAPNQLYKKLEDRLYKQRVPTTSFFAKQAQTRAETRDISSRLKEHAHQALESLRVLLNLPMKYHRAAATMMGKRGSQTQSVKEMIESSVSCKRVSIHFTLWKVAFLEKWIVSDCQLGKFYRSAHVFLMQLKKDADASQRTQEQLQTEQQLKRVGRLLRVWRNLAAEHADTSQSKARHMLLSGYFRRWKQYIVLTASKLLKIIKANEHWQGKLKQTFVRALRQSAKFHKQADLTLNAHLYRRYLGRWRETTKRRRLVRKVLIKAVDRKEQQEQQRYALQFAALQETIKKWREHVLHARQTEERRIKLLAADNFYKSRLLSQYYFRLRALVGISKGSRKLNVFLLTRCVKPRFELWRVQTGGWREVVCECNTTRGKVTLYKAFSGWKDVTLKNRLSKLMYTRSLFRGWLKTALQERVLVPNKHWEDRMKIKCWESLRTNKSVGWKKRRGAIIERELGRKRASKLGKLALVGLLELVLSRKKKDIVGQSVKEFRDIGLMRKGFTGISEYSLRKKRNAENEQKALTFRSVHSQKSCVPLNALLKNWSIYASTKAGEKVIVQRFRQFRTRLVLTKCFLAWTETAKEKSARPVKLSAAGSLA